MQSLTTYAKNPELMDSQVVEELWQLVECHPTYQAARLLLVRGLYQLQDQRFGAALRQAALMLPDRVRLFDMIERDQFRVHQERLKPLRCLVEEPATDRTQSLIDSFLSGIPEEPRPRRPHPADATVDYMSYLLRMEDAPADAQASSSGTSVTDALPSPEESSLKGGLPSSAGASLDAMPASPKERAEEPEVLSEAEQTPAVSAWENVEEGDSEILTDTDVPATGEELDEWPEEEEETHANAPSEAYFTETLARIYIKQCKYDKAIEIIRRLSLNVPEKNRYFADQIRFLEKLILNERTSNNEN